MRDDPSVIGFYEPLNEALASVRVRDIRDFRTDSWESRHPFQQRSYYDEFVPFMRRWRSGIARYDERFALDGWYGGTSAVPSGMHDYIAMLVRHAEAQGCVAVLKFTRSLGRLSWMTHAFPGAAHIVVVRNPLDQWCSAWDQAMRHDNPYFLIMPWLALHRNMKNGAVASLARSLDVTPLDFGGGRLQRQYDRALDTIPSIDPETSYRAFLVTWILGTIDALRHGDIVVDIDALHYDDAYRPDLEQSIERHTGIHVDFGTFEKGRRTTRQAAANVLDLEHVHHDARRAISEVSGSDEDGRRIAYRCRRMLERRVIAPSNASLSLLR
jgi:hypothetical protein